MVGFVYFYMPTRLVILLVRMMDLADTVERGLDQSFQVINHSISLSRRILCEMKSMGHERQSYQGLIVLYIEKFNIQYILTGFAC